VNADLTAMLVSPGPAPAPAPAPVPAPAPAPAPVPAAPAPAAQAAPQGAPPVNPFAAFAIGGMDGMGGERMEVAASASELQSSPARQSRCAACDELWMLVVTAASALHPKYALPCWEVDGVVQTNEVEYHRAEERHKRVVRGYGWALAVLRHVNMALWCALIGVYFAEVDGSFTRVTCADDGLTYCSNMYLLCPDCAIAAERCTADLFATVSVLVLMTVMQLANFLVRFIGRHGADRRAPLVQVSAFLLLLLLFALEAFALPFGTKEGHIAFAQLDPRGLNITAIVATASLFITLPLLKNGQGWACLGFGCVGLALLLAVVLHVAVSTIGFMVDRWAFVDATLFFVAWEKEQLAYRVLRSWFSALVVLENVLTFGFFVSVRRAYASVDKEVFSRCLPRWSLPLCNAHVCVVVLLAALMSLSTRIPSASHLSRTSHPTRRFRP
jgi:hypothetical protein